MIRKKLDYLIADALKQKHGPPIAILDLDGTLFDVTHRTIEIMRRFLENPELKAKFPTEYGLLSNLKYEGYLYSVERTLNSIGIDRYSEHSASFLMAAEEFWFKRFFTDELLAYDIAFPGAATCVNLLDKMGVRIIYLSGRDVPNMSKGTVASLKKYGFPTSGDNIEFQLKPAYGMDDLEFKKTAIQHISEEGTVIFTIDNEPANVDMFNRLFPRALNIHFKSQYAKEMPLSGENIAEIKSFKELGFE